MEGPREEQKIHQLSMCVPSGSLLVTGQGSLLNAAGPKVSMESLVWFCCFSGPSVETQLRPTYYLQGGKPEGGEVALGLRSLSSRLCPLGTWGFPPWWPSAPVCKLLSQSAQLSVSVSPSPLPRNFPNFLLSCLTTSKSRQPETR